jgi:hypothetical protein
METAVGILIGAAITWLVSRNYYQKAGRELREEAEKLRKKIDMVLRALEIAGLVTLNRGANDEILGINITIALSGVQAKMEGGNVGLSKSPP